MSKIVITSAKRTPIGKFLGGLSSLSAPELGKYVVNAVIHDSKLKKNDVDELILGQVLTGGAGQNPARQTSCKADIPYSKSAVTINQVCGSGLRAIAMGMQSLQSNQSEIIIAGGQESMSNAHHTIKIRSATKMGDGKLKDSMIVDGLWCAMNGYHMGTTAENVAEKYNISKDDQDKFATESQNKAENAQKLNRFSDEIVPISIQEKKEEVIISEDEFPRHGSTFEKISTLKPVFSKDGTVSAGNASGLNDGAAAVTMMNEDLALKKQLEPLARIVSWSSVGVDPSIMGVGPVEATKEALKKAKWSLDELDLIEANEAFAAQSLAVSKEIGWDMSKVNVNGGAIALGHPIGASGARILVTLIHELKKRNLNKGLATLCIGGGQGIAMCIER